ncbi:toprim domain-containing protein [Chitinophaga silvisoli]|uniref:Wadjet protein JetD C-terminal domain-containing protein n=1 Tax=Chitinophaga silvisoli TaxID=2291814 RepID=A0A3E1P4J3_9BACT|nr:hypothetical protein [Chitinophaga silvisoli]RFM35034.1 hypothetical protein DXN04_06435 [Chitinophaga silvisoli]
MKRELQWRHFKALNQLYINQYTNAKITDNGYIANVLITQKKLLKFKSGNNKIIEATPKYLSFYDQNFKQDFEQYTRFLQAMDLEDDARRKYTEYDIQTLMFISEYKDELLKNLTTIRIFSSEVFKTHGSKYLENKPGLKSAVCKILGIDDFPDKDPKNHQWRLVIDSPAPTAIILCENIAHLKSPWKIRETGLELWYVGGNNIGIIDFISPDKLKFPIYYSCDWDFHGLSIYSRIKYKMKQKSVEINLLYPYVLDLAIPVNSDHHNSNWNFNIPLSGLNQADYKEREAKLINQLIKENKWIEEESMDILELFKYNTSS